MDRDRSASRFVFVSIRLTRRDVKRYIIHRLSVLLLGGGGAAAPVQAQLKVKTSIALLLEISSALCWILYLNTTTSSRDPIINQSINLKAPDSQTKLAAVVDVDQKGQVLGSWPSWDLRKVEKQSRVRHVVGRSDGSLFECTVPYHLRRTPREVANQEEKVLDPWNHITAFVLSIIITLIPLSAGGVALPPRLSKKKEKKGGSSGGHAGGHRPTRACRPPAPAPACVQPAAIQPNPPTISSPVPARDGHPSIRPRRDAAPCVPVPSPRTRIGAAFRLTSVSVHQPGEHVSPARSRAPTAESCLDGRSRRGDTTTYKRAAALSLTHTTPPPHEKHHRIFFPSST
jgi:hypothetical protein